MKDEKKTKADLVKELRRLRRRISELESSGAKPRKQEKRESSAVKSDTADGQKLEQALVESEAELRTTIDNLPFDFFAIDRNGRYFMQNAVCISHWGNVIGKRPEDLSVDKEILELWRSNNRRAFAGETVRGEVAFKVKGEERYFYNIISPIRVQKELFGILGMNIDITDLKISEKEKQEKEIQYRRIVEGMEEGVWEIDAEEETTYVNSRMAKILGYTPAEMLGRKPCEFMDASAVAEAKSSIEKRTRREKDRKDFRFCRKDGSKIWLHASTTPVFDAQGEFKGSLGLFSDISDRKTIEEILLKSENQYRSLADNSLVGIYRSNIKGDLLYVNRALSEMLEFASPEEMLSRKAVSTYRYPEDRKVLLEKLQKAGKVSNYDLELISKKGNSVHVLLSSTLDNNVISGMIMDITKRISAEALLRGSEAKYRMIFNNSPLGILHFDSTGQLTDCNKIFADIIGAPKEKVIDFNMIKSLKDKQMKTAVAASLSGKLGHYEGVYRSVVGGKATPVKADFAPLLSDNGTVVGGIGVFEDITERRHAEQTLKESESKYRDLYDNAPDIYYSLDRNGIIVDCNETQARMLGYQKSQIIGRPLTDFFTERSKELFKRDFPPVKHKNKIFKLEREFVRKDGSILPVSLNIYSDFNEKGELIHTRAIGRDVTERKVAEEALKESEEKFREVFNNASDGIFLHDIADENGPGKFIDVNDAGCALTGYTRDELINLTPLDIDDTPKDVVIHVLDELKSKGQVTFETIAITKNGDRVPVEISNHAFLFKGMKCILSLVRDITFRKKVEEELAKAEKLESIGVLAGGIAHDFNNILTAIMGNIALAGMYANPGSELSERLMEAEKASLRAKFLTQQLLTFSKGGSPVKKLIPIAQAIKDTLDFALKGSRVQYEYDQGEDLWPVEVDEGQMTQVINNLVTNAYQAISHEGKIRVGAENVRIDKKTPVSLKPGKYVKLTVQDNGSGIPKEHFHKVFDPFFTTRQKGRGLGLTATYSIVKNHDGHIEVSSEPDKGTAVSVYLPVTEEPERSEEPEETQMGEKRRILLMDDEDQVRDVAGEMLRQIGYRVEHARDGAEAIERYKNALGSDQPFDMVIMDLTIPGGMGGKEAIKKLLEVDPDVKAIVSSGYSNDPVMADYRTFGFCGFIAKPYQISDLKNTLQEVFKR
jgi:PAS domain S-box-containing protein